MRAGPATMLSLALTATLGCKSEPGGVGAACTKKEDCSEGLNCLDAKCTELESQAEPSEEPTGYCATLADLAGTWTFDTTVIGAKSLIRRGINGHYTMLVKVENCEGSIELTKSGHDKVEYSRSKIQRSEAPLAESKLIPTAAEASVSLKGKPTHTFVFVVQDGQLFGHYQTIGDDWERTGMWGFLRGVRAGQDLAAVEDFSVQPCEVACLTHCDTPRRRADGLLDEAGLAACMTACGAGERLVGCGPDEALPEELVVEVRGPVSSLDKLCAQASSEMLTDHGIPGAAGAARCDRQPEVDGRSNLSLGKGRLNGSFKSAQALQIGFVDGGYTGEIVLAFETEAGWFWTEGLMDVSLPGAGGVSSQTKLLVLRPRDVLSPPGREVIADIRVEVSDSDLSLNEVSIDGNESTTVCSAGSPPACMKVTLDWSSKRTLIDEKGDDPAKHPDLHEAAGELYLAILPGDRVSISSPVDARVEDRELNGIYTWPE